MSCCLDSAAFASFGADHTSKVDSKDILEAERLVARLDSLVVEQSLAVQLLVVPLHSLVVVHLEIQVVEHLDTQEAHLDIQVVVHAVGPHLDIQEAVPLDGHVVRIEEVDHIRLNDS